MGYIDIFFEYVSDVKIYISCKEFFNTIDKIKLINVNKYVIYKFLIENEIYIDYAHLMLSCKYCNILLHDFITLLVVKCKKIEKPNFVITTHSYISFEQLGLILDKDPNFHTCNDILFILKKWN